VGFGIGTGHESVLVPSPRSSLWNLNFADLDKWRVPAVGEC
jgi:hypothetical protein